MPNIYYKYRAMIKFHHDGHVGRIEIMAPDMKDAKRQAGEYHGKLLIIEKWKSKGR